MLHVVLSQQGAQHNEAVLSLRVPHLCVRTLQLDDKAVWQRLLVAAEDDIAQGDSEEDSAHEDSEEDSAHEDSEEDYPEEDSGEDGAEEDSEDCAQED
jgi:hypothetical protein